MLRLRTTDGIEAQEYSRAYLLPFEPSEERLAGCKSKGLAAKDNGRWHLTPQGCLLSNTIIVDLQEAQEKSTPLTRLAKPGRNA